jgi:hypothetical protein
MLALGFVPAAAKAALPSSTITSWASQGSDPQGHPIGVTNGSYLIAYANPPTPTTLTVTGSATGIDRVDIVCYYGAGPSFGDKVLVSNVDATSGTFSASGQLSSIAGHACRLRAIPTGGESSSDTGSFAGPQVAVSEVELPAAASAGKPYDIYVDGTTFSGSAAWNSAGTCGPYAVPLDPSFGAGNYAIDCMGSLLGSNLAAGATRSEVQVDGQDAYDAASAQAVFGGTEDSADLPALSAAVNWDPATGLVSSQSGEDWVICSAPVVYPPTADSCPTFESTDVHPQDGLCVLLCLRAAFRDLDPACLAAAADLYLRLDHARIAEVVRGSHRLLGRDREPPLRHGDTVPREQLLALVLEEVHPAAGLYWIGRHDIMAAAWRSPSRSRS